jgi:DNA-binding transcriptional LysR family regulator
LNPVVLKHSHLSYFVKVAETGQITRAARILHIAQPALSQAITQLEAQLGVKLLERHPRGVSLTPAGAVFLEKAQIALEAQADAAATAASLARDLRGALQIGFLSVPPMLMAPNLLEAFGRANPQVEVSSRELRFPTGPTASWLSDVDVALCHAPVPDPNVEILVLRQDLRSVVLRSDHRLGGRAELRVADVIDEPFCGAHPSVDPVWASFWNLDDHRGAPPATVTSDQVGNTLEQIAAMASGHAISTFPAPVAGVIVDLVPNLVAVPIIDAAPASCALVWHVSRPNSVVADFVALARATTLGPPGRAPRAAGGVRPTTSSPRSRESHVGPGLTGRPPREAAVASRPA